MLMRPSRLPRGKFERHDRQVLIHSAAGSMAVADLNGIGLNDTSLSQVNLHVNQMS